MISPAEHCSAGAFLLSGTGRLFGPTGARMTEVLTVRTATPADLPRMHPVIERAYRGDSARQGWTHEADLLSG